MSAGAPPVPQMADQRGDQGKGHGAPPDIQRRVSRTLAQMRSIAPEHNECWEFFRGNTYAFRTLENRLVSQATAPSATGRGKPGHRVRTRRAIHLPIIRQEISYATQRVPAYEANPSNSDPEIQNAAHIASQVALYGYDQWKIKRVTEKVVTHALVADEGFAWPYWDTQVGPQVAYDEQTDQNLHEGEINIRTYSSNQVGWEPGLDFDDSPYYVVVQAEPIDQVKERPGYIPGELVTDATDRATIGGRPKNNELVLVIEYLERPSKKYSNGRRCCIANGRIIQRYKTDDGWSDWGTYPLQGPDGKVLNEPVLHKLSWLVDPDNDRDLGMLRFLLDVVRTYQDCVNKQAEWKNLATSPQMIAPPGSVRRPLTDEPGDIIFVGGGADRIGWRPTPPAPTLLSEMQDRAMQELGFLASQNNLPSQVEAARAIQALIERDNQARAAFISNLAEFHSRLMRHCLALVARHYTEKRLIKINGWSGPERIEDFKGADLMSQVDVRVLPGSIEPFTRTYLEQRIMNYLQLGLIEGHQAIAAIEGGSGEGLVKSYELDVARANRIIQQIFANPESVLQGESVPGPMAPDPTTGQPVQQDVPWWMPRRFDRIPIYKNEFENAMKTQRYDLAPIHIKTMLNLVYNGLIQLEQQEAMEAAQQQAQQAAQLGMGNASQPQSKPMPSLPGISGPGGQPDPAMAREQ